MRSDGSFICTFRAFRRGDEAAVHGLLADAPSTAVWRDGTAHDEFISRGWLFLWCSCQNELSAQTVIVRAKVAQTRRSMPQSAPDTQPSP